MASLQSLEQPNKKSYTLIWNLLILLLRQNGVSNIWTGALSYHFPFDAHNSFPSLQTVVGTDIAELLLNNTKEFPYEHQPNSNKTSENDENSRHSAESETKQSNEENISEDSPSEALSLSENEITDKFRNYLLYGSIIEALGSFRKSTIERQRHINGFVFIFESI